MAGRSHRRVTQPAPTAGSAPQTDTVTGPGRSVKTTRDPFYGARQSRARAVWPTDREASGRRQYPVSQRNRLAGEKNYGGTPEYSDNSNEPPTIAKVAAHGAEASYHHAKRRTNCPIRQALPELRVDRQGAQYCWPLNRAVEA
jgi:hypothetical protein